MSKKTNLTIREKFQKQFAKLYTEKNIVINQRTKLDAEIVELDKEAEKIKVKILEQKIENKLRIEQLGWESITDEEMKWAKNNLDRFKFMIPSLNLLRNWIADDIKDKTNAKQK